VQQLSDGWQQPENLGSPESLTPPPVAAAKGTADKPCCWQLPNARLELVKKTKITRHAAVKTTSCLAPHLLAASASLSSCCCCRYWARFSRNSRLWHSRRTSTAATAASAGQHTSAGRPVNDYNDWPQAAIEPRGIMLNVVSSWSGGLRLLCLPASATALHAAIVGDDCPD